MEEHPEVAGVPAGSLEDKELTLAFQGGDKGAYQAIYDRHSGRVHSVCRRMLGNPQDAQEAAQESFLRVYQALGRFNGRYQLGPWITRIATNVCLDHIRARSRRPADVAQLEVIDLDGDRHHDAKGPEFLVIRNAESRRVRQALSDLPPHHRAAIVLRDFEGLSYAEVAIALGMTECQVKALIHRARQNFKRSWTPLSLLMPWRLLGRVKEVDVSARDHVSQAIAATSQVAPACTSALQQCGQYMVERVAPIVTAAIVTAAGVTSHAATTPPRPEQNRTATTAVSAKSSPANSFKVLSQTNSRKEAEPSRVKAPAPTKAAPVAPTPEATSTPETTPEPEASPTPAESPPPPSPPAPSGTPKAAPQPFAPAVGFDYGRPVVGRTPRSHTAAVSCSKDQLDQRLETVVEDDDSAVTYPAVLVLNWDAATASALSMELTVWKNGHEIYYSGTADLADGSYPEGQRKMSFMGNYGTLNEQARSMDLPTSGRFTAALTLDCAALSVITESVVLGA